MKKFFFRLETLLRVRKTREGRVKRDLAHANQKWSHVKEKEKTLQSQMHALMQEIQTKREEGKLLLQETYNQILDHLNTSLHQVQQSLLTQSKHIQVHQEHLKRAVQERKVIEKIQEKHYTSWRTRLSQTEGDVLDEIGLSQSSTLKR